MSQPNLPDFNPEIGISRDDAVNLLLVSIAMEELGLAHIINAEGEKIQHSLGTLHETSQPSSMRDILAVNESAQNMLSTLMKKELVLDNKLSQVAGLIPEGPPRPPGYDSTMVFDQSAARVQVYPDSGDSTILDTRLTPISVTTGQQVKIDSTAEFILTLSPEATEYSIYLNYNLLRNGNLVWQQVIERTVNIAGIDGDQRFIVPMTFVDSPPDPDANYQIQVEVLEVNGLDSIDIENRSLTALLYN